MAQRRQEIEAFMRHLSVEIEAAEAAGMFARGIKRRFFPERRVCVGWAQRLFTVAGAQFYG